jgi:hypothetical protein
VEEREVPLGLVERRRAGGGRLLGRAAQPRRPRKDKGLARGARAPKAQPAKGKGKKKSKEVVDSSEEEEEEVIYDDDEEEEQDEEQDEDEEEEAMGPAMGPAMGFDRFSPEPAASASRIAVTNSTGSAGPSKKRKGSSATGAPPKKKAKGPAGKENQTERVFIAARVQPGRKNRGVGAKAATRRLARGSEVENTEVEH